ncbi:MAG TPA: Stp1/IreP family PP2C-type Ser/Thr phosphatase [Acidobacteriota bacterium]|nr:Stp1/IreP family PP2C-type Ser/Thr phosphatase [Acidobacteriota bacterium]
MHIEYGVVTDNGKIRPANEDTFIADGENRFFIVADGMGGHSSGEIASRIASSAAAEIVADEKETPDPGRLIHRAVQQANLRVYEKQKTNPEHRGMGSTLTALMLRNDRYVIAHVGDSRAYLFRGGTLRQLTRDHSLVWPLYECGALAKDAMPKHPQKNIVTRAVGTQPDVEIDIESGDAFKDDIYLLCSDGLTDVLTDNEIERILADNGGRPQKASSILVEAANYGGGPDNITALVVKLGA